MDSPDSVDPQKKQQFGGSTVTSASDLMASKSTKASMMSSSNTGTLLNAKSTLGSSSSVSVSPKPSLKGASRADANLDVIEEELMVEEGCDNELESNRMTLQRIRVESQTYVNGDELELQIKRCTITDSELRAV